MKNRTKLQQKLILEYFKFLKRLWMANMFFIYILSAFICEWIGQLVAPSFEWIITRFIIFNMVWFWGILLPIENKKEREFIRDSKSWMKISPYEFEHECARVLRKVGFHDVRVTKGSGDGGVDIIFKKDGIVHIAQCKQYKGKVSPEQVRALYGVREDFGADIVLMIAANGVTDNAYKFIANKKNYWLWTLEDLIKLDKISSF